MSKQTIHIRSYNLWTDEVTNNEFDVDENGFAHLLAGYVLKGYVVQGTDVYDGGLTAHIQGVEMNVIRILK